MENKLKIKDLISIGIFTAVYLVIFMIIVMGSGFAAVVYFFSPAINALILAPIFMLFLARTPKRYALVIMGLIVAAVIAVMMPALWPIWVFPIVFIALAEFFARKAEFKNFKLLTVSYIFFANWVMGVFSSFWIYKETFLSVTRAGGYPEEYVASMEALIQPHILVLMFAAVIVGAIVGSLIAKGLLKKHFKKAGII